MQETTLEIKNKLGLHARPAALFVQTAAKYKSRVRVFKEEQEVDGKSIMGVLTLAAECGSLIRIVVEGDDELEALENLSRIVKEKFREE